MTNKLDAFNQSQLKKDLPDIRPGDNIRVYQKIKDLPLLSKSSRAKSSGSSENKQKTQSFEGLVIARKHGQGISSTITVRKLISGIGVERVFPLHSPTIEKIDIIKRGKVRRAKLYYLRKSKGRKTKLKKKESGKLTVKEPLQESKKNNEPGR
jgi:large subunit ribosomal protein L19